MMQHSLILLKLKIDKMINQYSPKWLKPNHITGSRYIMVGIIWWLITQNQNEWGFVFFVLGALTDAWDGILARQREQNTNVGKIIDPLADKLLFFTPLIMIGWQYLIIQLIIILVVIELLLVLMAGVKLVFAQKIPQALGANKWGKSKFVFQVMTIIPLLFLAPKTEFFILILNINLGIVIVLSFLSFITHLSLKKRIA